MVFCRTSATIICRVWSTTTRTRTRGSKEFLLILLFYPCLCLCSCSCGVLFSFLVRVSHPIIPFHSRISIRLLCLCLTRNYTDQDSRETRIRVGLDDLMVEEASHVVIFLCWSRGRVIAFLTPLEFVPLSLVLVSWSMDPCRRLVLLFSSSASGLITILFIKQRTERFFLEATRPSTLSWLGYESKICLSFETNRHPRSVSFLLSRIYFSFSRLERREMFHHHHHHQQQQQSPPDSFLHYIALVL